MTTEAAAILRCPRASPSTSAASTRSSGVSFELRRGEVAGAGRRQRRRQVDPDQGDLGRLPARRGRDRLQGRAGQPSPTRARPASIGIETIYQDLALADNLDVGANIFLGREPTPPRASASCRRIDRRAHARGRARRPWRTLDFDIADRSSTLPVAQPLRRPAPGGRHRPRHLLERRAPDHGRADRGPRRARAAQGARADPAASRRRTWPSSSSRTICGHLRRRRPHPGPAPRHQGRRAPAGETSHDEIVKLMVGG